ncbi:MAG: 3-isopropylmalate dehydratase small subunit [Gaiellaceae bacterium]
MIVEGKAVVIPEDDVDTDVMYPGARLNIDDPEGMKPYLFEGYDPSLREQLGGDTVLVTGANFGIGSSREHVPQAMKAWGVRCVLGKSFARIFHRNCVNLGLPIVTCPGAADAATPGSHVRVDTDTGEIDVDGRIFQAAAMHPFTVEMVREGGLVPWARRKVSGEAR